MGHRRRNAPLAQGRIATAKSPAAFATGLEGNGNGFAVYRAMPSGLKIT
jgi:hypothetical protein